jgi:RsiW-degrading membrane proteinase PrsW (M82 family)
MANAVSEPMRGASVSNSDLRLAMIAGAGVTLSIAALVARMAGILPSGLAVGVVVIGATIALKVAFAYAKGSASAPSRARILGLVSNVGLAISAVTVIGMLPVLTKTGGIGTFAVDLVANVWTLTVLAVAAGSVRTLGWRAFVGAGLTGFLGITGIATSLGRPVVTALGATSLLAVAVWVPLTEELCKSIPVIFVVVVALRRTRVRPSALDLMMLGAWSGAGFAVFEDAAYGRSRFHLGAIPLVSLLFPTEYSPERIGSSTVIAGHLIFSALIGLGIGLAVLYRKRFRRPAVVLLVAALASVLEHGLGNTLALNAYRRPAIGDFLATLTLGGRLTSLLLIVGIGYVLYIEWPAMGVAGSRPEDWRRMLRPETWLHLSKAEGERRSVLLAQAQLAVPPSRHVVVPAGMASAQKSAV